MSNVPPQTTEVKEKESQDLQIDESVKLEQKDVTNETPYEMPKNLI